MILFAASLLTVFALRDADPYQLNREGRSLLDQHRYAAAARVFRHAADRAASQFGPDDPATAMILRNLALAYVQTGKSAAAEESAKLAYAIIKLKFGSADPALTPILNVLTECYAPSGRINEAQRAAEQAVSIGPSASAHFGTALHNLGALYEYQGDFKGAALLYGRAIDVRTEILGANHPYVALSKAALRRVQHAKGRATELSALLREP